MAKAGTAKAGKAKAGRAERLVFIPLGGSGEIGMNLNLYGYGPEGRERWIMVDCGVTFGDEATPGIDLITPDHAWIAERRDQLDAIILTHAHEDHIGAVALLWPDLKAPLYATPFTAVMVRDKLRERGLDVGQAMNVVPLKARFTVGPFDIEYISITHSIPEPNALAIRTPAGTVLHTGDWKIDPAPVLGETTDIERLEAVGREGVLACVCDSTNALTPGRSGSEAKVAERLRRQIGACRGRAIVTTFASNAARVKTVIEAAVACGRDYVLVGRSMGRIVRAAREAGYLKDVPDPVPEKDAGYLPRERAVYLCTGSQGEPRAALWRIAQGAHPELGITAGDTVIFSSKIIPGNEKSLFRLTNALARQGLRIVTEKDDGIHVSGHPCREELEDMYRWIKPQLAVPVHGEARHMIEHARLAEACGVPQSRVPYNGDVIELAPRTGEKVGEVPAGRLHLDGTVLTDAQTGPSDERRRLAYAGFAAITVMLDRAGGIAAPPVVILRGVPHFLDRFPDGLVDVLSNAVWESVERMPKAERARDEAVIETARQAVRRGVNSVWGKKPVASARVIRLA